MHLNRPVRLTAAVIIILSCMACDRMAKQEATTLRGEPPVRLMGGDITLSYAENRGAMLSLGEGLPEQARFLIFTAGVGALLAGIAGVLIFARSLSILRIIALALIFAGGAGNFVDRLFNDGRVVDFITIGFGVMRTGIFNVADIAIMAGAFLYLVAMTRKKEPRRA